MADGYAKGSKAFNEVHDQRNQSCHAGDSRSGSLLQLLHGDLGLRPVARWYKGAYLAAGGDWICLSLDPAVRNAPMPEYTHLAFNIAAEEFRGAVAKLQDAGVTSWQEHRSP
jgi:hypothetical protein